ncbi:MAG: glycine--tRNA ligase subunit beta [Proteobacteria bacterium]|nr:glycine--tRNA ligase subunit beta [Pseudomonadota bacterium]
MADLLLELFSEEIPARMQPRAEQDLKRILGEVLESARLHPKGLVTYSTPRRLVAHLPFLLTRMPNISEERRGPKVGAPDIAVSGFAKSVGVKPKDLFEKEGYLYATIEQKGATAAELLSDLLPQLLSRFPWPKSMRWGSGKFRWVRPLHSILCILDGQVVTFEVDGVKSGNFTWGHRFLAPEKIQVSSFYDYEAKLKKVELNLSLIYGITGQMNQAESILRKYFDEPIVYNNLGIYAHLGDDNDLAHTYLNKALTSSPGIYESAWNNLKRIKPLTSPE